MSAGGLFLGLLFSTIGLGFFIYGKKQRRPVPLVVGIALMVLPYMIGSAAWDFVVGSVLVAIPYFVRI